MSGPRAIIGLDLGGTNVKGLAVTADGRMLAEETRPTADCGDTAWRENVHAVCAALRARCPGVAAVGLCAPGMPARDERAIIYMPGRLRGLEGFGWSEFFGLPTVVVNDAHAALLGEVWQGAGRGAENVLMLTLGTGVGGAAMVDGRLLRGHLGRAGHLGHISLDPNGVSDIVGTPGSLEDAIGDYTVGVRTGGRFTSTQTLVTAALSGDAAAQAVWGKSVRALAAAVVGLINAFDPHTIIFGGGVASAGEALFGPLRAHLDTMEWRPAGARVSLVASQLGANAGAVGAGYRAHQSFHSS